MKNIDLAVDIIKMEADDLWQQIDVPNYSTGASIADALTHFIYYVQDNIDPEHLTEFRRALALQFGVLNERLSKFK